MNDSYSFVKYIYLIILFIFAFVCFYSERLEIIGFGSTFLVNTILIICIMFDIYKDKERGRKLFIIPSIKISGVEVSEISCPLYLLIIPLCLMQMRVVCLLSLNIWSNISKYGFLKISRDNRYRVQTEKLLILLTAIMLFAIVFLYILYNYIPMNDLLRFFIAICIIGTYVMSIIATTIEMTISNEFSNTTDG